MKKEIYTDLEKKDYPGVAHTSFNLKLDQKWAVEFDPFEGGLIIGHDIDFVGEPTIEGDNIIYKIKAISDKAKKIIELRDALIAKGLDVEKVGLADRKSVV